MTSNSSKGGLYVTVQGQLVDGELPSRISGGPWLYVRESHSTDVSLRQHSKICYLQCTL